MPLNNVERGIIGEHLKHLKNYPNPEKNGNTEVAFKFDDKLAKMLYDNLYNNENFRITDIDGFCKRIINESKKNYSGTISKYLNVDNNKSLDIVLNKTSGDIEVKIKDDNDNFTYVVDTVGVKGYVNGKLGFSTNSKDKSIKKHKYDGNVERKFEILDNNPITDEEYKKIKENICKIDVMFAEVAPELIIQLYQRQIKKGHIYGYEIKDLEDGNIYLESKSEEYTHDLGDRYLFYNEVQSIIMDKNGEFYKKSSIEFFDGLHREEKIAEIVLNENNELIKNQLKGKPVDEFIKSKEDKAKLISHEYNIYDELYKLKDRIKLLSPSAVEALKREYNLEINKVNNEIENSKDNKISDLANENNQVINEEHEQLIDEKQELTTDEIILNNDNNEETKAVEEKNKVDMEQNEKVSDNMIEDELLGYSIEELEKMDADLDKEIEDITIKNEELSKRIELIERIQNKMGKTKSLKMEYKQKMDILKNKGIE